MITNFFSAVDYGKTPSTLNTLRGKVDDYFYLGGRKAQLIQGKEGEAVLLPHQSSHIKIALKVASYFTIVLPLVLLSVKVVSRLTRPIKVIDPKKELEKEIDLKPETIEKIRSLSKEILNRKDHKQIDWISKSNTLVLRLQENPNYVFKFEKNDSFRNGRFVSSNEAVDLRFEKCIRAKEAEILFQSQDHAFVPSTRKYTLEDSSGKKIRFLVEKHIELACSNRNQQELFYQKSGTLVETVTKLAEVAGFLGLDDICPRNIPLEKDRNRFVLLDTEYMDNVEAGFLGCASKGSCGLIQAFTDPEADAIIEVGKKYGLKKDDMEKVKEDQLSYSSLRTFHKEKGVLNPQHPVGPISDTDELLKTVSLVNIAKLPKDIVAFNVKDYKEDYSYKQIAEELINYINQELQKNDHKSTFFLEPRKIHLDFSRNHKKLMINHQAHQHQKEYKEILEILQNEGIIYSYKFNGMLQEIQV